MVGLGYRVAAYTRTGQAAVLHGRGRRDQPGALRPARESISRCALRSSAGGSSRPGSGSAASRPSVRTGIDLPASDDRVGALFGRLELDNLDDLAWPEHGRRLAVSGEWSLERLGADRSYWRVRAEGRVGRPLGGRLVAQLDGVAGFSGGRLPAYEWHRLGGVILPGYRHEELKGAQALAAALSLRYRVIGQLRLLVRGGAGDVFARTGEITLGDLRWGAGVGLYHPSPIGPVSLELAVRDGGDLLTTLSVGWN